MYCVIHQSRKSSSSAKVPIFGTWPSVCDFWFLRSIISERRVVQDKKEKKLRTSVESLPIGSMVLLYMVTFTIFYHQYTPNVSIYTIHGSYGIECLECLGFQKLWFQFRKNARFGHGRPTMRPVWGRLEGRLDLWNAWKHKGWFRDDTKRYRTQKTICFSYAPVVFCRIWTNLLNTSLLIFTWCLTLHYIHAVSISSEVLNTM